MSPPFFLIILLLPFHQPPCSLLSDAQILFLLFPRIGDSMDAGTMSDVVVAGNGDENVEMEGEVEVEVIDEGLFLRSIAKLGGRKGKRTPGRQRRHGGRMAVVAGGGGSNLPGQAAARAKRLPNVLQNAVLDLDDRNQTAHGLTFLLQKELKNSDVGTSGRIVLPKKEAEAHLPPLAVRDGILLTVDDMDTMQEWIFKYRFWPNNRSRMYLLENAGDFIKFHDLRPGDMVMIYKNNEKDRYIIRAKKATDQELSPDADYDGIFDSIVPEISVPSVRYSDIFLPLADGACLSYAFSADLSMADPEEKLGNNSLVASLPIRGSLDGL